MVRSVFHFRTPKPSCRSRRRITHGYPVQLNDSNKRRITTARTAEGGIVNGMGWPGEEGMRFSSVKNRRTRWLKVLLTSDLHPWKRWDRYWSKRRNLVRGVL